MESPHHCSTIYVQLGACVSSRVPTTDILGSTDTHHGRSNVSPKGSAMLTTRMVECLRRSAYQAAKMSLRQRGPCDQALRDCATPFTALHRLPVCMSLIRASPSSFSARQRAVISEHMHQKRSLAWLDGGIDLVSGSSCPSPAWR
jgi:hypothetical protein